MGQPKQKSNQTQSPPLEDTAVAKAAYATIEPRMKALPKDRVQTPNTLVDLAVITALAVARRANQPEMRARFESLPRREFDLADLNELETLARAAWWVQKQLAIATAKTTDAKLPVALVNQATALRSKMSKLLEYYFDADSDQGIELAAIRLGTGYRDLASDLARLAQLYRDNLAVIENDTRHYEPGDAALADQLAQKILDELGEQRTSDQSHWSDEAARSWTLLYKGYDNVADTGRWLKRFEGGGESDFPSLVAAGRVYRPKSGKGVTEADPATPAEAPAPAPTGAPLGGLKVTEAGPEAQLGNTGPGKK